MEIRPHAPQEGSNRAGEPPPALRAGLGRRVWVIPEGYIPARSSGPAPEMLSHETACILNTADRDARVRITLYFPDREPVGPYRVTVAARRTLHLRFNDLDDPEPVPLGADYASVFESDVPVVIQHTRLDSRQAANALISTIAYAAGEPRAGERPEEGA